MSATSKSTADAARKRAHRTLARKLGTITAKPVSLATPTAHLALHEERYAQVDEIFQEARAVNDNRLALAADKARGEIAGDAARLQGFEKTASPLVDVHIAVIQLRVAALSGADLDALIRWRTTADRDLRGGRV